MIKKIKFQWLLILLTSQLMGQYNNLIAYTIPKNEWRIENGSYLFNGKLNNDIIIRYGASDKYEVYLYNYGQIFDKERFNYFRLISKYKIFEKENKYIISTLGKITYDNSADKRIVGDLVLSSDYYFDNKWVMTNNFGAEYGMKNWIFGTSMGYYLTDKIFMYSEYYGLFDTYAKPYHTIGLGTNYQITPKFWIDVVGEKTVFTENSEFYLALYFTYRLMKK